MVSFSCIFIRRNTAVGHILPRQLAILYHGSWPFSTTAVGLMRVPAARIEIALLRLIARARARPRGTAKSGTISTWFSIAEALGVDVIELFDESR